jgi:hypothetical protein
MVISCDRILGTYFRDEFYVSGASNARRIESVWYESDVLGRYLSMEKREV